MLLARNIAFVQVKSDNVNDVIRFCGVPQHGLEQELIFHDSDPYLIPTEPKPTPLDNLEGCYIVRFEDSSLHVFTKSIFTGLFSVSPETKTASILREENSRLNSENERLVNALDYVLESGAITSRDGVEKAKWGLGLEVENEAEIAALKPRFS